MPQVIIFTELDNKTILYRSRMEQASVKNSVKGYDFKPLEWTHATNIYEVNIRQYTKEGDFRSFSKELPRLKDMGVKTLWFMPITPISQKNKKGVWAVIMPPQTMFL
jgi:1,4-alpha-glucan branching enzyme